MCGLTKGGEKRGRKGREGREKEEEDVPESEQSNLRFHGKRSVLWIANRIFFFAEKCSTKQEQEKSVISENNKTGGN